MHPVYKHSEALEKEKTATNLAHQKLAYSVLRSGLLPYTDFKVFKRVYDSSGLGGSSPQETPYPVSKWKNINTDMMILTQEYEQIYPHSNMPLLNGVHLLLNDYQKELIDGFRQMYHFVVKHRQLLLNSNSPLTTLAKQKVRFVFRSTAVYSSLL